MENILSLCHAFQPIYLFNSDKKKPIRPIITNSHTNSPAQLEPGRNGNQAAEKKPSCAILKNLFAEPS
jgi:hypothetical protein